MNFKTLRMLHLYLGCFFTPLLIFFTLSGVWQSFDWQKPAAGAKPGWLAYLSTIHKCRPLKDSNLAVNTWCSTYMHGFVILMCLALLLTLILGIVMSYKAGRRGIVSWCLLGGILVPVLLVLLCLLP